MHNYLKARNAETNWDVETLKKQVTEQTFKDWFTAKGLEYDPSNQELMEKAGFEVWKPIGDINSQHNHN